MGGAEFIMKFFSLSGWHVRCLILVLLALFFLFCMRGYQYISYTLLFAAFLVLVGHAGSPGIRKVVAIVTAVGLLYFCALEVLVISNARGDKDQQRDYLIVLGAGVRGETPTLSLLHRLQKTEEYLRANPESIAVVSGGQGDGENISEGECMRRWLVERGIEDSRIIAETKSTSTMENLKFSAKLIEDRGGDSVNIAVLSSPYHLYRAKCLARSLGLNPAGVACVHGYPIYSVGMYIREAFGITHMWVFGD